MRGEAPAGAAALPARLAWPAVYLVLAVGLWAGVWTAHPTATATCGCGDAARFTWYFAWAAHALSHGLNPLHSGLALPPGGVDTLDDTSVLGLGLLLAPLTWAFGPVLSMNVALTAAPVASACAMAWVLARWGAGRAMAGAGGLLFGFSPFLISESAYNQLNLAVLASVPVVAYLTVDLIGPRRLSVRAWATATVATAVVQFFVGLELLVIEVTVAVPVLVVAVAVRWWRGRRPAGGADGAADRREWWRALAARLGWTAGAAAVLLAGPVWVFYRGAGHVSGPIWSSGSPTDFGADPAGSVLTERNVALTHLMHAFGGYQGHALPYFGYLGPGVVALSLAGVARFRRDRPVRWLAVVAVASYWCAMRPGSLPVVPGQLFAHLPVLRDVVEVRFVAVTVFATTALIARAGQLAIDRTVRHDGRGWAGAVPSAAVAAVVLAAGVGPTAVAFGSDLPLATRAVSTPTWFVRAGAPASGSVLVYPMPNSGLQSALAWHAVSGLRFTLAGFAGPEATEARAGRDRRALALLDAWSLPAGPPPAPDAADLSVLETAFADWRVTEVVVPQLPAGSPSYDAGRGSAEAVRVFTAVLGAPPVMEHGAALWRLAGG